LWIVYSKHTGFVVKVPRFIVKLTPLLLLANRGAVRPVSDVVLHVTLSLVPSAALGWIVMSLFVVTAVVLIMHVAVDAFVAHENAPAGAALHATSEGLAPEPAAEQFVVVSINGVVSVPVNVGEASGAHPVQAAKIPAAVSKIPLSVNVQVVLDTTQDTKCPVVGTAANPATVFVAEVAELLAQIFPNAFDALNISSVPVDVLATPNDGVNEAEGRFELPYHIFPVDKTAAMN
jgi:hypothetical protein